MKVVNFAHFCFPQIVGPVSRVAPGGPFWFWTALFRVTIRVIMVRIIMIIGLGLMCG